MQDAGNGRVLGIASMAAPSEGNVESVGSVTMAAAAVDLDPGSRKRSRIADRSDRAAVSPLPSMAEATILVGQRTAVRG
jgi:hypothetical protein